MTPPIRRLDLGVVSPPRSQAVYHGLAEAMTSDSPDTIALLRPAAPYFCVGFHQNPAEELDLAWCRRQAYPVLHRRIGGGTVYLDGNQLFYQCVFHRSRAPFDVASIYRRFLTPAVEALRRLGLDARLSGINEIEVATCRIAGTGGGLIGEAIVVVGNFLFDFPCDVMARAWNVPSASFRRLAHEGLRRHLATLAGVMASPPTMADIARLLMDAYAEGLDRPLVAGELNAVECAAIDKAAAELAAEERDQGSGSRRSKLKITDRVTVHEWTWPTPAGEVRVTARVADGEVEDLVISGSGPMAREEAERRIRSVLAPGSAR